MQNIVDLRVLLKEKTAQRDAEKAQAKEMLTRSVSEGLSEEETAVLQQVTASVPVLNDEIQKIQAAISKLDALEGEEESAPAPAERSQKPKTQPYAFPSISVDSRKERSYDLSLAMRSYADGRRLNGYEGEWHQEISRNKATHNDGFFVPWKAKVAGLRADFTLSAGAATIVTHVDQTPIEYLRNLSVFSKAGARFITGLPPGIFSLPRQSGTVTASWVSEGNGASATAADMSGGLTLTPQTLTANTTITRAMMKQSGVPDIAKMLGEDLFGAVSNKLDNTGLQGSGSGQPYGILNDSNVPTVSIGTNGGAMTLAKLLELEKSVAENNAEIGERCIITSPAGRSTLKSTVKVSGQPVYLWADDDTVVSYKAFASMQVPKNLTKGTSSGTCTAVVYGNFYDYIIATWGEGIEVAEDPYGYITSGGKRMVALVDAAMGARHGGSLAKIVDFVY